MKNVALIFLTSLLLNVLTTHAQNKTFGVGTSTLNPNAALQVDATNQGLQLPRLSTSQRTGMTLNATDKGLMVFDTDLNAIHTWSGTAWTNGQKLTFPYKDSLAVNPAVSDAFFHLVNASNQLNADVIKGVMKGTGGAAGSFILRNATSTKPAIYGETIGTGSAAFFKVNNKVAGGTVVYASTNSDLGGALAPVAVYGESTGTGSLGAAFWNTNPANTYPALYTRTLGPGNAAMFEIVNASSNASAVFGSTAGTGSAGVYGKNTNASSTFGTGVTGEVNSTVFGIGVFGKHTGTSGFAGSFEIQNPANSGWGVKGSTDGTGAGVYGANYGSGNGNAAFFEITDAANTYPALYAKTVGTGAAVSAESSTGFAALHGYAHGSTTAVSATTDGTSNAGYFAINNASNGSSAINASTTGTGAAIFGSTSSGYTAVAGQHNGASNGFGGLFEVMNAANTYQAIKATTFGAGNAAFFEINNSTNGTPAVQSMTNGTGAAGDFQITNAASSATALFAKTNGTGAAIQGRTSTGTAILGVQDGAVNGIAGLFDISNSANNYPAIQGATAGGGSVLFLNHNGASGNIAVFQSASTNVARIDKTGKGFFNGGTQNNGADVAELFDVEGNKQEYEPGDVLVISESTDRTVEKSSTSNSTKVAGVYATKPGVTLTEKGIDESLDELVPMGVIGVIPTKVCNENGPIKRGDLLVTSSTKGHAMKAISAKGDGMYPAGVIIGKALENFETGKNGIIKVLVNIK